MSQKNSLLIVFTIGLFVLFSQSCKTDKQGEEGEQTQQQSSEVTNSYSKENTAFVRLPAEPDRLNPLVTTSIYSRVVYEPIFLYLLQFDPETLELEPQLAKGRPQIEELTDGPYAGGVSYTYEILEEAKWDNGTPIQASDFEFTLKALFNPLVNSTAARAYLDFIKDIEIDPTNPKKFTVYTNQKYIIGEAAISNLPIYPAYIYDANGLMADIALNELTDPERAEVLSNSDAIKTFADAFNSATFGREIENISASGPYAVESWEANLQITLKRKENWWGDGLINDYPLLTAYPDKIVFKIIPDPTTAIAALKEQSIDVTAQIDAKDFTDLKEGTLVKENYNLFSPTALQYYYLGINTKDPSGKLSDKRVRRALAHLVDVDKIISDLFYGLAQRTVGPIHPSKSYYNKSLKPVKYDLEKAKALLAEAGWTDTNGDGLLDKEIDGERVEFKIKYLSSSSSNFARNLAAVIKNSFQQAGVELDIELLAFGALIERLRSRDYEMHSGAWGQDPVPTDLKQIWHTESDRYDGSNRSGFGNVESDELIDEIRVTLDEKERHEMYLRIQEMIYDEQPYVFLFAPQERIAIHKRFDTEVTSLRPGFVVNEISFA